MQAYILVLLSTILTLSTSVIIKKTQQGIKPTFPHLIMVNLINSIFGTLCFWVLGKFRIGVDPVVLIYAAIFPLFVIGNLFLQLLVYSRVSVSFGSLINTSGRIILSILFGTLILREPFSLRLLLAVLLLIAAALIPCRNILSVKTGKSSLFFCALWFLVAGGMAIFCKIYSIDERLTDTNSMFFFTNVFCFAICLVLLIGYRIKNGTGSLSQTMREVVRPRIVISMGINTIPTNFVTIVNVIALQLMPLSVHTVLTSSLALVGSTLLSLWVFRERVTRNDYIALILAVIAIALNP
ncbi:MAG: hypothetical protein E7409_00645 [Ruminococcaceae bacterium]|nr:hypothetical protein [Oscillospiraceae bacterium]